MKFFFEKMKKSIAEIKNLYIFAVRFGWNWLEDEKSSYLK